jgi:sortase (surface protein transpeptidase)
MDSVEQGDVVFVRDRLGRERRYRVAARELIPTSTFPDAAPELFDITGPDRLTLITCGGAYERNAGGYQANIVVTALPA